MRKINKNDDINLREKIAHVASVPKDVIMGASIVTITGNSDVWIENYKGLIEYNQECIILQTNHSRIIITGKRIRISHYSDTVCVITGKIDSVQYSC